LPALARVPSRALLTVIALVAMLSGACAAPSATPSPTAISTAAPTASPTAAPTASPTPVAEFPAALTDDEGTAVDIPAQPEKIVSLTPATTEIVYAVGAGDRLVATDDSSDFPTEATALPHVATFSSVDVEKIVASGADLVIAGGLGFTPADAITKLRDLKIPVLVVYAPSVDGVYKDIQLIGKAVGDSDEADDITSGMKTQIDAISSAVTAAATAAGAKPRVYYEIGYTDSTGQIYAPADKSFVAEMVTLAGGATITTGDPNNYEIPLEKLIAADPQIIVIGTNAFYSPAPTAVATRTGWKVMTAVKNHDIRTVDDTEITRPGPRLAIGLANLAKTIWPDVQLPATP
jgi:iron complex transport system substrate-binding protein